MADLIPLDPPSRGHNRTHHSQGNNQHSAGRAFDPHPIPLPPLEPFSDSIPPCQNPAIPQETYERIVLATNLPRQRIYLIALLHGHTKGSALAAAGIARKTFVEWTQRSRDFNNLVQEAYELGFATVVEKELYARAFAGPSDRGSMRALELVVKHRNHEYRDNREVRLSLPVPDAISNFSPDVVDSSATELPPDD